MAAREDHARRKIEFQYLNVKKDRAELERMMRYTRGRREVPVIVDGDRVTVGFGGT
jgi:glutaredoxin